MKSDPPPVLLSDTPHDRFVELGKKIMAVPKSEVDAREKKWHQRKQRKRRVRR
jgi:hypothetical protein